MSRQGVFRLSTTCPALLICSRSLASARRVMERHHGSSHGRSSAAQRIAACRLKPCSSAHSAWVNAASRGRAPRTVNTVCSARRPNAMRQAEPGLKI